MLVAGLTRLLVTLTASQATPDGVVGVLDQRNQDLVNPQMSAGVVLILAGDGASDRLALFDFASAVATGAACTSVEKVAIRVDSPVDRALIRSQPVNESAGGAGTIDAHRHILPDS